jgi:hypothetical protein
MIFTKIDAIRFAEDFNDLTQIEKSSWLDRAYVQEHSHQYQGLAGAAQKALMDSERQLVNGWKKRVGRVTTARNRLRGLFTEVV